jgi:ankyrin repeat protein
VGAIDTDVNQSKKDRLKVMELLIDAGADVNATFDFRYGWRICDVAAMAGDIDMVTLLLRRGADLNGRGKDPLHPDKPGNAPLHWAVQYNHIKVANLLIERGADSNLTGAAGLTPLQLATELHKAKVDDYQSIIDLLIDAANVR